MPRRGLLQARDISPDLLVLRRSRKVLALTIFLMQDTGEHLTSSPTGGVKSWLSLTPQKVSQNIFDGITFCPGSYVAVGTNLLRVH